MIVTVQRFLQDYPEFRRTSNNQIKRALAAASRRIAAATWADREQDAIMLLAAHKLSISPEGEKVRLKKENRVTTYWIEYERVRKEVTLGLGRVI